MTTRLSIIAIATVVALVGCDGNRDADLGACKIKAREIFKADAHQSHEYIYDCMVAAGYRHEDGLKGCSDTWFSWDKGPEYITPVCFYPANWVNRLVRAIWG
jgi:hypothetical protein